MSVRLIYEMGVDDAQVKRSIRSIESEAKASNSRMAADSRRSFSARGSDPSVRQTIRGFDQIGRAARAADAAAIRARMRDDRRAEQERLRGIAAEEREAVRAAQRIARARQQTVSRIGGGIATSIGGSVKKVIGLGANALALGGGLLGGVAAGGAIESEIEIRAAASKLANQARRPELKGTLAAESKGVRGFTGTEALGAMEQFVNLTGDLDTARKLLPDLGKLALATNSDIGELAATAGNAFIPLADQIKDPTERLRVMKDVLAAIAGQGAVGAVEIKDLAKDFAGLAATSNRFAGNKGDVLKMMGAIAQAARQRGGASSAAVAVNAVERFAADLVTKSASGGRHTGAQAAKMMGIDVFTDKGKTQLKNPEEIIVDILQKTQGDLTKIGGIFGARSIKAFMGFAPLYNEAEAKKKGTGEAAVRAEFSRLLGAQFSTQDIERGAQNRYSDEDVRLKEGMKRFNDAVGTKLLPVLTALIPKFTELIPKIADVAGVLADFATKLIPKIADVAGVLADFATNVINNPLPNIGMLIAGKIALDLAGAGIEAVVTAGFARIFALAAGGSLTSAAASGVTGLAAKAGLGAAGTGALALGATGAVAIGAVGAAGYNAYKLSGEIDQLKSEEGNQGKSFWDIMSKGPSRGTSREEYDALYGPGGKFAQQPAKQASATNPPASPINGTQVGKDIGENAGSIIAQKLASANVGGMNPRRTNPILDR